MLSRIRAAELIYVLTEEYVLPDGRRWPAGTYLIAKPDAEIPYACWEPITYSEFASVPPAALKLVCADAGEYRAPAQFAPAVRRVHGLAVIRR